MELLTSCLRAFLAGGALCCLGQILIDKTALTPARILTSYVVAGVLLGAAGVYGPFAEWAGAGARRASAGFRQPALPRRAGGGGRARAAGRLHRRLTAASAGVTAAVTAAAAVALIFKPHEK